MRIEELEQYFEKHYQLRPKPITLRAILKEPAKITYFQGIDSESGKGKWTEFNANDFIEHCFTQGPQGFSYLALFS